MGGGGVVTDQPMPAQGVAARSDYIPSNCQIDLILGISMAELKQRGRGTEHFITYYFDHM